MASSSSTVLRLNDENDYDGNDLRDMVREQNLARPKSWPQTDVDLDVSTHTMETPADITSITAKDWHLIENYNIRAIGLGTGKSAQGYLVQYLHVRDNHELLYLAFIGY